MFTFWLLYMTYVEKSFLMLCIITGLTCLYIIYTYNHINALVLFFIVIIVHYGFASSINNNWVSLIILLWYARSITVLFYLMADETSSFYTNYKPNPIIIWNNPLFLKKKYYQKCKSLLNKIHYRNLCIKINLFKNSIKSLLNSMYRRLCSIKDNIYYNFIKPNELLHFLCYEALYCVLFPQITFLTTIILIYYVCCYIKTQFYILPEIFINFLKEKKKAFFENWTYSDNLHPTIAPNLEYWDVNDICTSNDNLKTNSVDMWYNTPEHLNNSDQSLLYTDLTNIYNSIISNPSSLFLILFLLPLFLYLIYFICNYISHRKK